MGLAQCPQRVARVKLKVARRAATLSSLCATLIQPRPFPLLVATPFGEKDLALPGAFWP